MYRVPSSPIVASRAGGKAASNQPGNAGWLYAGDGSSLSGVPVSREDVMFAQESMRERYVFTDVTAARLPPELRPERGNAAVSISKWMNMMHKSCVKAPVRISVSATT